MRKKLLVLCLAAMLLVTSLGLAPVANAADADAKAQGNGALTAEGDGIAILGGKGRVHVEGNGILWIKDFAGNASIEVTGTGEKTVFPDGWVQYAGFHGQADVAGTRIIVVIAGVDIELSAEGRGRVILWGHGTYERNGQDGEWREGLGKRLKLAE